MRALLQIDHGNPQEVVRIVELPDPEPGAGEIVIEIEAAGLHLADIKNFTGERGFTRDDLPRVPGYEGVGRVIKVGEGVESFSAGDRAFPPPGAGTFCQQVCVEAARAVPAPAGDASQLALATINGPTALFLLEDYADLEAGDWLLQNGANSNCGRYIIALAKERGIRTCNVVRRAELADELYEQGANSVVVDVDDPDEFAAIVKEKTGGPDFALGIDMVSGDATMRIARALPDTGTVVNYGFISGESAHMAFGDLFRGVKLRGMSMRPGYAKRTAAQMRDMYEEIGCKIGSGQLKAAIAAEYPLEQCYEAFRHAVRTGDERKGKIVILPNA